MKLSEAVRLLSDAGIKAARQEARKIFSLFEGIAEYKLIASDPEAENQATVDALLRRAKREPLQYIIGEVGFYKETYKVSPDCLIPREDTEVLVDYAVKNLPAGASFIDLCTGSGCIAISTLKNTRDTRGIAVDISEGALAVARENAKLNGVSSRLEFSRLDILCDPLPICQSVDAILSNPPYVTDAAYLSLEDEIYHEPRMAFVGGEDGGDFYRHITKNYKSLIKKDGFIAYEIGYDQRELISKIAEGEGMSCEIICDLSGNPRVAVLKAK